MDVFVVVITASPVRSLSSPSVWLPHRYAAIEYAKKVESVRNTVCVCAHYIFGTLTKNGELLIWVNHYLFPLKLLPFDDALLSTVDTPSQTHSFRKCTWGRRVVDRFVGCLLVSRWSATTIYTHLRAQFIRLMLPLILCAKSMQMNCLSLSDNTNSPNTKNHRKCKKKKKITSKLNKQTSILSDTECSIREFNSNFKYKRCISSHHLRQVSNQNLKLNTTNEYENVI